jgi:hypothetical protein
MLPATLREALRTRCVHPVVGAGVSRTVRTLDGAPAFPTWAQLLERAAQRLDEEARPGAPVVRALVGLPEPRYAEAREHAVTQLGRTLWIRLLEECFDRGRTDIDARSLAIPQAIWTLGSNLVLTTNFDRVLRWGCPNAADLEESDFFPSSQRGNPKLPHVWHLNGSVRDPWKMERAPYLTPGLLEIGHALSMTGAGRHALFIGYDVDDPATIPQFGAVLQAQSSGPHYALARPRDLDRLRHAASGADVSFIEFSEYGPPLEAVLGRLADAAGRIDERAIPPDLSQLPPNRKRWDVYLGYAKPDREIAERLSASLHARGVDVFFDRWEIGPGMIVEKQREQGMRDSLVSVLLVSRAWSPSVFEEFFALLESSVAGDRLLVPVLLDDTAPPAKLAIREPVDLRGGESAHVAGVEALVGAVRRARESSPDSGR